MSPRPEVEERFKIKSERVAVSRDKRRDAVKSSRRARTIGKKSGGRRHRILVAAGVTAG